MAATQHSARVFIAVDPVQDYEETLTIFGVYGSLAAAQVAVRQLRNRPNGFYSGWPGRTSEVQEWVGDEHRNTAVVLSGYASDLYDRELYAGWDRITMPAFTGNSSGVRSRTEVLWSNRPLATQGALLEAVS
jgi:hypothetical protein